jgi:alpha-1,3-mannosyltransferase
MKILHVVRQYAPSLGGLEKILNNLVQFQRQAGHSVSVACLDRPFDPPREKRLAEEWMDAVRVLRIPYIGPRRYAVAPRLLSLLSPFDVIHLHSSDFFLDYLSLTRSIHRKPIILSTHGFFFHTDTAGLAKKLYFQTITRLDLRQVSAVVCSSRHDMELAGQIAPSRKLFLLPNSVDIGRWREFPALARDPNLILCVERLADNKRHHLLIASFQKVLAARPSTRLVIIGPDAGTQRRLEAQVQNLGLSGKIILAGGIPWGEFDDYLRTASVWVSASRYESFGIALVEAMAAGCIPVVQKIAAFQELLEPEHSGFFTDYQKPEMAASAILQALDTSDEKRSSMVAAGREKASQFSIQKIGARLHSIYESVLEPPHASGR